MKLLWHVLAIMLMALVSTYAEETSTNIVTTDGVCYSNVVIKRIEPDGITLLSTKGVQKIGFDKLPDELKKQYNYDSTEANNYSHKMTEARIQAAQRRQAETVASQKASKSEPVPECKVLESAPRGIGEPGTRYFDVYHKSAHIRFEASELPKVVSALNKFAERAEKVDARMPDVHLVLMERPYSYMGPKKLEILSFEIDNG